MKETHLFYAPDVAATGCLPEAEARHAVSVLRLREGDDIVIATGSGTFYDAEIRSADRKGCTVCITGEHREAPLLRSATHIALAPTRTNERTDWFVEKATEAGVDGITLILTERTARTRINLERLERIAIAAMKQSHRATLPRLEALVPLGQLLQTPFDGDKLIAHCHNMADISSARQDGVPRRLPHMAELISADRPTLMLIGPEGDFTEAEVHQALAAGFEAVSLGESRLRTETAALSAVFAMSLIKRLQPLQSAP